MPEHNTRQTSIERLEEAIHKLTQHQSTLSQNQQSLTQANANLNLKLDSVLDRLAALTESPPSPKPPPSPPPNTISRPHMKLEVPHFDGQDPLGRIFKITQLFDYQGIPDAERITVASFYMEGLALCWFQWMSRNGFLTSWPTMLQALESRFAPSYYDDPHGALFKLQQRGTVNDYLAEFEHLANHVIGLSPPLLMSCFIYELSLELRREVQALQPMCLPQAVALAKLQEDKFSNRRRSNRATYPTHHQPQGL